MATESRSHDMMRRIGDWIAIVQNKVAVQILTISGFLLLWEIGGQLTSRFFLAPPSAVVIAGIELFGEADFIADLQIGILALITGTVLGIVLGLIFGIAMGFYDIVENLFDPYFTILYSLPIVALVPFIVLVFGTGFMPRVFIIFLFAFIPMTISTLEGANETPEDLQEVGKSFGASRSQLTRLIYFPSMVPYMLSGARLGVGRGLRGWVVAELFFLIGVGGRLLTFANQFRTAHVFAVLVVFTVIGVISTQFVYTLSGIIAPWYNQDEGGEI